MGPRTLVTITPNQRTTPLAQQLGSLHCPTVVSLPPRSRKLFFLIKYLLTERTVPVQQDREDQRFSPGEGVLRCLQHQPAEQRPRETAFELVIN